MPKTSPWKPQWTNRPDGISETPVNVNVKLNRREYATLRRFATDHEMTRSEALETIFRIGMGEASETHDPSKSAAAAILHRQPDA